MTWNLKDDAFARTLIAAHRGVAGGDIPGNTPEAFDTALCQGADMVELDVSNTADGELFVFHPGMEPVFLHSKRYLKEMTAEEARKLVYVNGDGTPTEKKLTTFDAMLEHLKDRCYINVDKFWDNVEPITRAIRRHGMAEQILVKTGPNPAVADWLEQNAPEINYMLILSGEDTQSEAMLRRKLNYIGVEALFDREDCPIAGEAYAEWMRKHGLIRWVNAIVYDHRAVLAAGHNDNISAPGRMDEGWGWLLDHGFNIIQTDWPMMLRHYMEHRK